MRELINKIILFENKDALNRHDLLGAIYAYGRDQISYYETRSEFDVSYAELMSHLRFPIRIYRALSFDSSIFFDAHTDDLSGHEDEADLRSAYNKIDWDNIGTHWTFDHAAAFAGGALGGGAFNHDGAHIILEAEIALKQCDLLSTLFQNLTVFQEEKEVRLWPEQQIEIISLTPNPGFKFPIKASTGKETEDNRSSILYTLKPYWKKL